MGLESVYLALQPRIKGTCRSSAIKMGEYIWMHWRREEELCQCQPSLKAAQPGAETAGSNLSQGKGSKCPATLEKYPFPPSSPQNTEAGTPQMEGGDWGKGR